MVAWTTPAKVDAALGVNSGALADPYLTECTDAANDWAYRKRKQAGYTDPADPASPAPSADIGLGATLYAVALWRERASVDGFQSFGEVAAWSPTGGSLGQIKRLLGIPRAATDGAPAADVAARRARRRRLAGLGGRW